MKSVLRQLNRWRFRERLVRLTWGSARWLAVVGTVLAFACLADWLVDRYSGSKGWREFMRSTRIFAPSDPLAVGHTPLGLRVMMFMGQVALAAGLAYYFLVRPWVRTPPVDDLAFRAEKAFPAFDHRLVTAIQLNRPTADTRGMSQTLIAEVTREAGEIATSHNLLSLVDYKRLRWAAVVVAPVAVAWAAFIAWNPSLAAILLKRQALMDVRIPRDVQLRNVTQPIWPTGADVVVRVEASGRFDPDEAGVLSVESLAREPRKDADGNVVKDGQGNVVYDENPQPPVYYTLANEKNPDGTATPFYSVRLERPALDFRFSARLGDGVMEEPGRVTFVPPPQLEGDPNKPPPLTAVQILPDYLGRAPDGLPYVRRGDGWTRGEVIDALPRSRVGVEARFNKPVKSARLIPIERDGKTGERELRPVPAAAEEKDAKGLFREAAFEFPTTPRMIGYRIELTDELGFSNPTPIRRNIRMWEDRPPTVDFRPESTRNPDPNEFDGQGNPKDYEWDMALGPDGLIQVIYHARSEVGIRAVNIRYRVIPKGVDFSAYPEEYRKISHPRDDPNLIVYDRLVLSRFVPPRPDPDKPDAKVPELGPFVPDLGLFQFSYRGAPRFDRNKVNVEFYPLPSRSPSDEPGELEAGGRRNFEVSGLLKKMPSKDADGRAITIPAKIELGDTVEVYLEAFDKLPIVDGNGKPILGEDGKPLPPRPAGYTREAKRKILVTEAEAALALRARDEARQRLRDKLNQLAQDQADVFRPKKAP